MHKGSVGCAMKFTADRPFADPEKAARKILEIANSVEAVQDGRIHIEKINGPFLKVGSPAEYGAACSMPLSAAGCGCRERHLLSDPPRLVRICSLRICKLTCVNNLWRKITSRWRNSRPYITCRSPKCGDCNHRAANFYGALMYMTTARNIMRGTLRLSVAIAVLAAAYGFYERWSSFAEAKNDSWNIDDDAEVRLAAIGRDHWSQPSTSMV